MTASLGGCLLLTIGAARLHALDCMHFIDLLMGLFRPWGGAFPLNGLFSDVTGQFPRMPQWAVVALENENPLEKKRPIKRYLSIQNLLWN